MDAMDWAVLLLLGGLLCHVTGSTDAGGVAQHRQGLRGGYHPYRGLYRGVCEDDGLYYFNDRSFVHCESGNSFIQVCAPGTVNAHYSAFQQTNLYGYSDFCDMRRDRFLQHAINYKRILAMLYEHVQKRQRAPLVTSQPPVVHQVTSVYKQPTGASEHIHGYGHNSHAAARVDSGHVVQHKNKAYYTTPTYARDAHRRNELPDITSRYQHSHVNSHNVRDHEYGYETHDHHDDKDYIRTNHKSHDNTKYNIQPYNEHSHSHIKGYHDSRHDHVVYQPNHESHVTHDESERHSLHGRHVAAREHYTGARAGAEKEGTWSYTEEVYPHNTEEENYAYELDYTVQGNPQHPAHVQNSNPKRVHEQNYRNA